MQTYQNLFKALTSCLICAGKKDIRYYLNGVHIKQSAYKLIIEATDGHRLIRFESDDRIHGIDEFDVILDRFAVTQLLNAIKNVNWHKTDVAECTIKNINNAPGNSAGFIEFDILKCELIDGRFPDCDRVIWKESEKRPTDEIALNAGYFSDIYKVITPFNKKNVGLKLQFKSALDSMRFDFDTKTNFSVVGIIMPCRL